LRRCGACRGGVPVSPLPRVSGYHFVITTACHIFEELRDIVAEFAAGDELECDSLNLK
jgi:hypothetical protein